MSDLSPVPPPEGLPPDDVPPAPQDASADAAQAPATPEQEEPFPFWGLLDVLIYVGLALPLMLVAASIVALPLAFAGVASKGLRVLLPQFVGYVVSVIPLWLVFRSRYQRSPLDALRLRVPGGVAVSSFWAGTMAAVSVLVLGYVLRTPAIRTPMQELLQDPVSIAVVGVLASTLGPLFEEVFFRGLLQPVLARRWGVIAGIVLASLPFALLHGHQYSWSWRHLLLVAYAGALFGWQRHRTGSTGAATIMHAAYNLVLFVLFLIGRAVGTEMPDAV